MSNMLQSVDQRTRLAGTNRLEVLLFSLGKDRETGREEVFGINVFKVKEVMHVPEITRAPDMPNSVEGMVSLRGVTIPVINLPHYCNILADKNPKIMIISEYNKHVQGFLVHAVDSIQRMAWEEVKVPPSITAKQHGGLVTAVAEVANKGLVMIMDVEKILTDAGGLYDDDSIYDGIPSMADSNITALFADDSSVARGLICRTFDEMGIKHISTVNGQDAWEKLNEIASATEARGDSMREQVQFILTDIEMPEMDGYVLTRKIKEDPRFAGIPVVMHSSLSAEANQSMGERVGADAYVAKFEPQELATTLVKVMSM